MKKYFFVFVFLLSTAQALLPPLYETLQQFQGLLNEAELTEKLDSGEALESIQKNDSTFTITTNKHILKANVETVPQSHPGPGQYKYVFGDKESR